METQRNEICRRITCLRSDLLTLSPTYHRCYHWSYCCLCTSAQQSMSFGVSPVLCFHGCTWAHLTPGSWLLGYCLHTLVTAPIFHGTSARLWHGLHHTCQGGGPQYPVYLRGPTSPPLLDPDDTLPCGMQDPPSPSAPGSVKYHNLEVQGS